VLALLGLLLAIGPILAARTAEQTSPSVLIPAGPYRPLFPGKDAPDTIPVAAFRLDRWPVTNAAFAVFVADKPKWSPERIPPIFTEPGYLRHWQAGAPKPPEASSPVTNIPYFAARTYCRWRGGRLPTVAEWERVGAASQTRAFGREEPGYNQTILNWYGRPTPAHHPAVGQHAANYFGVHDLHGLVWEWTDDFNSALVTGESRADSALERGLFCGSGAVGSADPSDYAAFMRFAFRSGLKARYVVANLGFRCAYDLKETPQ
jgi:formylglycine-generating enzyme required for sulfatase activity